jgi:poly-gamma-glutamate capsule biosynthesis protein CapA/YwtB (metallophosphatase superfamily)
VTDAPSISATSRTSEELRFRREANRRAVLRRRLVAAGAFALALTALAVSMKLVMGASASAPAKPATAAPVVKTPRAAAGLGPGLPADELAAQRISFAAVGDMAFNQDGSLPSDGRVYFRPLRGALSTAKVTIGNVEGTLATGGSSKCGSNPSPNCYAFRAPPRYAKALAASGFDVGNTANNHGFDYGTIGRQQTLRALRRAGVRPTGAGSGPTLFKVGDVRIAVLGFAPEIPGWNIINIAGAVTKVEDAAEQADIVIVTMHAGAEGLGARHVGSGTEYFLGENRGNVKAFSHAVVDAGADLVVGHGPHVIRGMEWRKGRLIAYSMGNFAGHGSLNWDGLRGVTGVLRVTLRGDGTWVKGNLVPVRTTGIPRRDRKKAALDAVRNLSRADFGSRGARIAPDGTIRART